MLNFDPIPNIGYQVIWSSYLQFTDFAGLAASLILPPGYKLAITTNLAMEMVPYFEDAQINPLLVESARKSLAKVKRNNIRDNKLSNTILRYCAERLAYIPYRQTRIVVDQKTTCSLRRPLYRSITM